MANDGKDRGDDGPARGWDLFKWKWIAEPPLRFVEMQSERRGFSGLNFSHALFEGSNLIDASFANATLDGARFNDAHLEGALFSSATLHGARLNAAHLEGASLSGARLEGALLTSAHLARTFFGEAVMTEANLDGVDLSASDRLTQEQINATLGNHKTKLPSGLKHPENENWLFEGVDTRIHRQRMKRWFERSKYWANKALG